MVFLADRLRAEPPGRYKPLVLMGSEIPFPFRTRPSAIVVVRHAYRDHSLHAAAG